MPDSIRIKEIHQALQADKFAYLDEDLSSPRVANLGYLIERVARVLGISVNSDGSIRSVRQSRFVPQGEVVPAGWSIAQWGRNQGASKTGQQGGNENEDRDGLAYQVRSGWFGQDEFTKEPTKIEKPGYVLVESYPQLLHVIMQDLDRALGLKDAGAFALPDGKGTEFATFEGMYGLIAEIAYMISRLSEIVGDVQVSSLRNQAILYEVLNGLGLDYNLKEFEVDVGTTDPAKVPYPGLRDSSPTLVDFYVWILANLSMLVGSKLYAAIEIEEEEQ